MIEKTFQIIKKIIFSALVLYGYNVIMSQFGLMIPINIITVMTLTILGLPSLFGLIVILLILF